MGFVVDGADGFAATGATGTALFQPPKSSSVAIFGGPWIPLPLLLRPEADDEAPPHEEKSLVVVIDGDFPTVLALFVASFEGSDEAQASLEAHGSAVEKPESVLLLTVEGAAFCVACRAGLGAERLKAEFVFKTGAAGIWGADSFGGASEKPNRSFRLELRDDFEIVGDFAEEALKSALLKPEET